MTAAPTHGRSASQLPGDPNARPVILAVALPASQRAPLALALGNLGFRVTHSPEAFTAVELVSAIPLQALVVALPGASAGLEALLEAASAAGVRHDAVVFYGENRAALGVARAQRPTAPVCIASPGEHSRLARTVLSAIPPELRPRPESPPRRVLVAADDPVHRKLLQLRLSQLGFLVVAAEDGNEALERARRTRPDAVVADVLMPGLDGFQLCLALRRDPVLAPTPVVLSSAAVPDELDLLLAQNVGANMIVSRSPDRADEVDALLAAMNDGAPPPHEPPEPLSIEQHTHRIVRQLERQVGLLRSAEQSLRESEERYRLVLEGANDGIWDWDLSTDEVYWNPRMFEITGIAPASFRGTVAAINALIHPEDRSRVQAARVAHMDHGQPYDVEFRLRHAQGAWRTVVSRGKARFDESGHPIRMAGTLVDVTDVRRAESEQRFLAAVSAALGPTLDVDATLPAVVSLAAEYFRGPCAIEALDQRQPLRRFTAGGDTRDDAERVPLLVRDRRAGTLFVPAPPSDPAEREARDATVAEFARRISAAFDAAWLYRRARDAVHVRDEFLSIASHELKTPLTSLQLHVQALLSHARAGSLAQLEPARAAQKLDAAERQTRRLTKLVNELLDVSRVVNGRLELVREDVDLGALVRDIAARYSDEANNAGTPLRVDAPDGVTGQWDRLRLEQVLVNLLSNAMKYGNAREIHVTLSADATSATLTVKDEGIGIDPSRLPYIFDRFERAVSSRHYGGLGLGLYIVRQIVEAHGGTIDAQSMPGAGSVFTVVLPRGG